jgi:hypothetical protein
MPGLRPLMRVDGSPFFADQQRYQIAVAYTTKIYHNDPVKIAAGTIIRGVAAGPILGVLQGVEYIDPNGIPCFDDWWPGLANCTDIRAVVVSSPDVIYEVQTSTAAGAIAAAYRGAMVDFALGTGSDFTHQSGAQVGAAGGKNFIVHDIPGYPNNDLGGTNILVHVVNIQSQLRPYELST